jgi:hypothetical protein
MLVHHYRNHLPGFTATRRVVTIRKQFPPAPSSWGRFFLLLEEV